MALRKAMHSTVYLFNSLRTSIPTYSLNRDQFLLLCVLGTVFGAQVTEACEDKPLNMGGSFMAFCVVNGTHYLFSVNARFLSYFNDTMNAVLNYGNAEQQCHEQGGFPTQYDDAGNWTSESLWYPQGPYARLYRGVNETAQPEFEGEVKKNITGVISDMYDMQDKLWGGILGGAGGLLLIGCACLVTYRFLKWYALNHPTYRPARVPEALANGHGIQVDDRRCDSGDECEALLGKKGSTVPQNRGR